MTAPMTPFRLLFALVAAAALGVALHSPATAQDADGDIDEESLLEKARPMVKDLYLHPDAIDPPRMLRTALQRLEHRSPQILVLERDDEALIIRVADEASTETGSERVIRTADVDLETAFDLLESAVLWIHPQLADAEITEDDLRTAALTGALRTLDRHSSVIAGDRLADFNTRFKGTLVGIGSTIGRRDGALRIIKPFADTPAMRSGLQPWDAITFIDGVNTEPMSVNDAVDRIRGPEGVPVVLTVQRPEEEFTRVFVIVRDKVLRPSVESSLLSGNVGYIAIDHFSKKTSQEVVTALTGLTTQSAQPSLKGLVIDLRGNQGGSMIHAARIVNNFVEEGMLVQTEGRNGGKVRGLTWKVPAKPARKRFDGPVVVLVDRRTASGSEIVAGGLKFMERGLILGRQTFGKGTVQKVYSLTDGVSMKLTVARYLLPGEKFINSVGVTPDVATGQLWLDPIDPTVPDEFVELASAVGLNSGDGGLDARRNPGAGRAPTSGGINAAPEMRLLYPRTLSSWGKVDEEEPTEVDAAHEEAGLENGAAAEVDEPTGPPEELTGDAAVRSSIPGDAGDERFNDVELRIAHDLLLAAKPTDRREELILAVRPIVASWQTTQAQRLATELGQRDISWTPTDDPRWLDRSPALDAETDTALAQPLPPLEVSLKLPEILNAGEESAATLTVRNTGERSWTRLRARLESSSEALDDASFVLGDLEPGAETSTELFLRLSSRAESREDVWRLYLLDDDGPLGQPWTGTLRTQGLPATPLLLRVATAVEPDPNGGIVLRADVSVRNESGGPTGDVRLFFGNPPDETVERIERFRNLDPIEAASERSGSLSLRVRDPAALGTIPISLRATDTRTGDSTTVSLELPTGAGLPPSEWYRPAKAELKHASRGSADKAVQVAGTVTSPAPLASVEVLVDRDKLYTRRVAPGDDVRTVPFMVQAPIDVGPNLVIVRTKTADGVSWTERSWVLGER
ncbi:MAG: PDZ domain-containing protein [Deltaproteobacteria bacterium]|nr:PDZ domain-containing protein [Deltaproteobacteria bacterium]